MLKKNIKPCKYDNWRVIPGHSFRHYYSPCIVDHICRFHPVESHEEFLEKYGKLDRKLKENVNG